jgi:hypothetical protein
MDGAGIKVLTSCLIQPEEAEARARREWHARMEVELRDGPKRTFRVDPLLAGDVVPFRKVETPPRPTPPPSQPAVPLRPAARLGDLLIQKLEALSRSDLRKHGRRA